VKSLMTRCGGTGLILLGLACATLQAPKMRTANPTPLGNCLIAADRVSVRNDGDIETFEYAGQSVVTCPGHRPTVYTNLTIRQRRSGEFEMSADRVELK
jgi:hypothetical protein